MTIGTSNRNDAVGNDATATYTFGFKIFAAVDLLVTVRNVSTGVENALSYPSNYSVSGVGVAAGGSITLLGVNAWQNGDGTLKTGYAITIRRVVALSQATDIRNQGDFFASVHEDAFDYLTMIAQQLQDQLDRSIKLPETEAGSVSTTVLPSAALRASKIAGWDASGNLVPVTPFSPGTLSVSAFIETLLDDASAAAARATLLMETKSTVASAATPDIWTGTGQMIDYTGTSTATGFANAPQAGARRTLIAAAACFFTAGANLIIPGIPSGKTFAASANMRIEVIALSTTQFLLVPMALPQLENVKTLTGTSIEFTNIPPWVTKITGTLVGASMDNNLFFYEAILGDSGGYETSGYASAAEPVNGGTRRSSTSSLTICSDVGTSGNVDVVFQLTLHDRATNTWILSGSYNTHVNPGENTGVIAGTKALSGTLDRIKVQGQGALDNWDAGNFAIKYE